MTGFVIGDDYLEQRLLLVAAFKVKGPGELVHPWIGSLLVQTGPVDGTFSAEEGGAWNFTLDVTEHVEERGPSVAVDIPSAVVEAVVELEDSAIEDGAASIVSEGFLGFVGEAALATFGARILEFEDALSKNRLEIIDEIPDLVSGSGGEPETLADLLRDIVDTVSGFDVLAIWLDLTRTIFDPRPAPSGSTPDEIQAETNTQAVDAFFFRISLAYLVRAISGTQFEALDDAIALRDTAVDRINAELEHASGTDVYNALADLRTLVVADVDRRATDLAELLTVEVTVPRSSLELAWSRYGDPLREAEIAERNAVQHPAFIAGSITLLSE